MSDHDHNESANTDNCIGHWDKIKGSCCLSGCIGLVVSSLCSRITLPCSCVVYCLTTTRTYTQCWSYQQQSTLTLNTPCPWTFITTYNITLLAHRWYRKRCFSWTSSIAKIIIYWGSTQTTWTMCLWYACLTICRTIKTRIISLVSLRWASTQAIWSINYNWACIIAFPISRIKEKSSGASCTIIS